MGLISIFCVWLVLFVRFYCGSLDVISRITQDWDCKPFSDDWVTELLKNHNLAGIKVLLFEQKLVKDSFDNPGLACAVCLPVPVHKSVIFLDPLLLDYPQSCIRFIVSHELGHIIYNKGWHKICWPSGYNIRKEISADMFAASIVSKKVAIEILEQLPKISGIENTDLSKRIMALHMPTLFRQYA